MQIVYARQPLPSGFRKSLYLAGPTPRDRSVPSWRPAALAILTRLGYDGTVFVPEDESWGLRWDTFVPQVDWELAAMHRSDQIVFWIPRDLTLTERIDAGASAERALRMPAFTTNVEFGFWLRDRQRIVLGSPDDAPKNRYLDTVAEPNRFDVVTFRSFDATLNGAVNRVGEGAFRTGGECGIPIHVWNAASFQEWYRQQRAAGNYLVEARVEWTREVHNGSRRTLLWAIGAIIRDGRTDGSRVAIVIARFDGDGTRKVVVDERQETVP